MSGISRPDRPLLQRLHALRASTVKGAAGGSPAQADTAVSTREAGAPAADAWHVLSDGALLRTPSPAYRSFVQLPPDERERFLVSAGSPSESRRKLMLDVALFPPTQADRLVALKQLSRYPADGRVTPLLALCERIAAKPNHSDEDIGERVLNAATLLAAVDGDSETRQKLASRLSKLASTLAASGNPAGDLISRVIGWSNAGQMRGLMASDLGLLSEDPSKYQERRTRLLKRYQHTAALLNVPGTKALFSWVEERQLPVCRLFSRTEDTASARFTGLGIVVDAPDSIAALQRSRWRRPGRSNSFSHPAADHLRSDEVVECVLWVGATIAAMTQDVDAHGLEREKMLGELKRVRDAIMASASQHEPALNSTGLRNKWDEDLRSFGADPREVEAWIARAGAIAVPPKPQLPAPSAQYLKFASHPPRERDAFLECLNKFRYPVQRDFRSPFEFEELKPLLLEIGRRDPLASTRLFALRLVATTPEPQFDPFLEGIVLGQMSNEGHPLSRTEQVMAACAIATRALKEPSAQTEVLRRLEALAASYPGHRIKPTLNTSLGDLSVPEALAQLRLWIKAGPVALEQLARTNFFALAMSPERYTRVRREALDALLKRASPAETRWVQAFRKRGTALSFYDTGEGPGPQRSWSEYYNLDGAGLVVGGRMDGALTPRQHSQVFMQLKVADYLMRHPHSYWSLKARLESTEEEYLVGIHRDSAEQVLAVTEGTNVADEEPLVQEINALFRAAQPGQEDPLIAWAARQPKTDEDRKEAAAFRAAGKLLAAVSPLAALDVTAKPVEPSSPIEFVEQESKGEPTGELTNQPIGEPMAEVTQVTSPSEPVALPLQTAPTLAAQWQGFAGHPEAERKAFFDLLMGTRYLGSRDFHAPFEFPEIIPVMLEAARVDRSSSVRQAALHLLTTLPDASHAALLTGIVSGRPSTDGVHPEPAEQVLALCAVVGRALQGPSERAEVVLLLKDLLAQEDRRPSKPTAASGFNVSVPQAARQLKAWLEEGADSFEQLVRTEFRALSLSPSKYLNTRRTAFRRVESIAKTPFQRNAIADARIRKMAVYFSDDPAALGMSSRGFGIPGRPENWGTHSDVATLWGEVMRARHQHTHQNDYKPAREFLKMEKELFLRILAEERGREWLSTRTVFEFAKYRDEDVAVSVELPASVAKHGFEAGLAAWSAKQALEPSAAHLAVWHSYRNAGVILRELSSGVSAAPPLSPALGDVSDFTTSAAADHSAALPAIASDPIVEPLAPVAPKNNLRRIEPEQQEYILEFVAEGYARGEHAVLTEPGKRLSATLLDLRKGQLAEQLGLRVGQITSCAAHLKIKAKWTLETLGLDGPIPREELIGLWYESLQIKSPSDLGSLIHRVWGKYRNVALANGEPLQPAALVDLLAEYSTMLKRATQTDLSEVSVGSEAAAPVTAAPPRPAPARDLGEELRYDYPLKDFWRAEGPMGFLGRHFSEEDRRNGQVVILGGPQPHLPVRHLDRLGFRRDRIISVEGGKASTRQQAREGSEALGIQFFEMRLEDGVEKLPLTPHWDLDLTGQPCATYLDIAARLPLAAVSSVCINVMGKREQEDIQSQLRQWSSVRTGTVDQDLPLQTVRMQNLHELFLTPLEIPAGKLPTWYSSLDKTPADRARRLQSQEHVTGLLAQTLADAAPGLQLSPSLLQSLVSLFWQDNFFSKRKLLALEKVTYLSPMSHSPFHTLMMKLQWPGLKYEAWKPTETFLSSCIARVAQDAQRQAPLESYRFDRNAGATLSFYAGRERVAQTKLEAVLGHLVESSEWRGQFPLSRPDRRAEIDWRSLNDEAQDLDKWIAHQVGDAGA